MFCKINENLVVSLDAVANINVVNDKMVFNMCYSFTDKNGIMSEYYYVDLDNDSFKQSTYYKNNFIEIEGKDRVLLINKKHVSFVKKENSAKSKLIIGFKNSIERHNVKMPTKLNITPAYMYIQVDQNELDNKFNELIKKMEG